MKVRKRYIACIVNEKKANWAGKAFLFFSFFKVGVKKQSLPQVVPDSDQGLVEVTPNGVTDDDALQGVPDAVGRHLRHPGGHGLVLGLLAV